MFDSLIQFPVIFGFLAAMAHVLAGPDHLAAIAPIAARTRFRVWMIGMSWGIGHLAGMMLIGLLFYLFRDLIPVDFISTNSERLVGLLLILIGMWAIFRIYNYRSVSPHTHAHTHEDTSGDVFIHSHDHDHPGQHTHAHEKKKSGNQTYLAALGIGMLHGLAGFSHILSLLPTLALPGKLDAAMYLTGFAGGTIIAMVGFSVILGFIGKYSNQKGNDLVFKSVNGLTALCAIGVGLFWLWNTW